MEIDRMRLEASGRGSETTPRPKVVRDGRGQGGPTHRGETEGEKREEAIVLRHEREARMCSRCSQAIGPGIVGARREEVFCEDCLYLLDARLGMLLLLGMQCRILAWRSRFLPGGLSEDGRSVLLELFVKCFATHEDRYADGPVRWMKPELAGALGMSCDELLGGAVPKPLERPTGRRVLRRAVEPSDDREPDLFDEVALRLGMLREPSPEAAEDLELEARRAGEALQSATALLASRVDVEPPDALAIASLVEIVDIGGVRPHWQERDAARALAWLIQENAEARREVERLIAAAGSEIHPGCLLRAAKREALGDEPPTGRPGRRRRCRPGEGFRRARSGPAS